MVEKEKIETILIIVFFFVSAIVAAIYFLRKSHRTDNKIMEDREEKRKDPRYRFEEKHYNSLCSFMAERKQEKGDDEEDKTKRLVLHTALGFLGVGPGAITRWADAERALAEATKDERTEEYRKKYVSLPRHREDLLNNADRITRQYQELLRNFTVQEYFKNFVSPEVIKMWEEDYRRLELAKYWEIENQPKMLNEIDRAKRKLDEFKKKGDTYAVVKNGLDVMCEEWNKKLPQKDAEYLCEKMKVEALKMFDRDIL